MLLYGCCGWLVISCVMGCRMLCVGWVFICLLLFVVCVCCLVVCNVGYCDFYYVFSSIGVW